MIDASHVAVVAVHSSIGHVVFIVRYITIQYVV